MVLVTVVHFVPFTYERGKCDSPLYWNIKSEMSNPMMLQVHLNSRRPGPLQNSTTAVDMCCRLHASYFANVQKSEIVKLFTLLFFFFHWHYVKFCEAVVQKCMYKIPLFVDLRLLQKLWLREGGGRGNWRRSEETTNTVFASSQVKSAAAAPFPADSHFLRAKSDSAVRPITSPQSQSTNISVCV